VQRTADALGSRRRGTDAEPLGHVRLWLQTLRDWKRRELLKGRRLKGQNFVIEARDLAGAKRSYRLPWRSAEKVRW